jgi:hypothetical protein
MRSWSRRRGNARTLKRQAYDTASMATDSNYHVLSSYTFAALWLATAVGFVVHIIADMFFGYPRDHWTWLIPLSTSVTLVLLETIGYVRERRRLAAK